MSGPFPKCRSPLTLSSPGGSRPAARGCALGHGSIQLLPLRPILLYEEHARQDPEGRRDAGPTQPCLRRSQPRSDRELALVRQRPTAHPARRAAGALRRGRPAGAAPAGGERRQAGGARQRGAPPPAPCAPAGPPPPPPPP